MVHDVCDDDSLQRSDPQIMEKYDTDVESVNVVGQQINRLADRRLAQRGSGHLQRLAVDKRAAGHANLHAHVQDTHHIWMNDKHVDSGA